MKDSIVNGLTLPGCRKRQQRLAAYLQRRGLAQALICQPSHVYYLTGFVTASYHASVVLLTADETTHLVLPVAAELNEFAACKISTYESHRLGTLVEDQFLAAMKPIEKEITRHESLATDMPQLAHGSSAAICDISTGLLELRRKKDEDEIGVIRDAVRACEAGYAWAAKHLQPGVREIEVYAAVQAAAVEELGEPIGELGNDFQSGTPGGPPRERQIQHGELMPLDVSVSVRGYHCDLCRTFVIGNQPSSVQRDAFELVRHALHYAASHVQRGGSCRQLYEEVKEMLDREMGWRFGHHLGHGIGLSKHESPHLNPHWDDVFEIGDTFTLEPGVYHEELSSGVRIEENYWLSPDGLVCLSSFPIAL
jgi:Xaa-Pro aminopeptidase